MMKHSKSTYMISSLAMLESFSYILFTESLVMYMVDVLHFSEPFSSSLFGIVYGSTYLFQILGGYFCDRYFGNRKSVMIGIVLIFIAQLIFTYDASLYTLTANVATHSTLLFTYPEIVFLIGTGIMAIGVSFFKVSIASFLNLIYKGDEKELDSAFGIFYMFLNIGGFFAPLTINFVVGVHHPSLYQYGFFIAAMAILIAFIILYTLKDRFLILPNGKPVGVIPRYKAENSENKNNSNSKLSKTEISRMKISFLVILLVIIYIIGNQQIFSSMIIFAENHVNNVIPVINYPITPQFYFTIYGIFIIILSPIYIKLFKTSAKKNKEVSSFSKIGIGLIFLGLAYLIIVLGVGTFDSNMKISMIWITLFYFIFVNSELLVMPVSLSLISKLAPEKYKSSMIGIYYLSFSIASVVAGTIASALPTDNNPTMLFNIIPLQNLSSFFMIFVAVGFATGAIWLLFNKKITKSVMKQEQI